MRIPLNYLLRSVRVKLEQRLLVKSDWRSIDAAITQKQKQWRHETEGSHREARNGDWLCW